MTQAPRDPNDPQRPMGGDDVELIDRETVYRGYFRMDKLTLRHRLFNGGFSAAYTRELFERGHAAALLPYDPERDEVVLIEQFRVGALEAPGSPWLMEVVAGIIEPGEDAEAVARREAVEEAGLEVDDIELISEYLPSPGGCSELISLYVGRVDAASANRFAGLAHEHEDIRVHRLTTDEALALLEGGRINNAAAIIALQWLALNRAELRRRWRADA